MTESKLLWCLLGLWCELRIQQQLLRTNGLSYCWEMSNMIKSAAFWKG